MQRDYGGGLSGLLASTYTLFEKSSETAITARMTAAVRYPKPLRMPTVSAVNPIRTGEAAPNTLEAVQR